MRECFLINFFTVLNRFLSWRKYKSILNNKYMGNSRLYWNDSEFDYNDGNLIDTHR